MMRRAFILIALSLAAGGCGGPRALGTASDPGPAWLVGEWVAGSACESDAGVRFTADGRYHVLDSSGTWRLDGDRLTTKVTEVHDETGGESSVGDTHSRTIRKISDDMFQYVEPDGGGEQLKRCPD